MLRTCTQNSLPRRERSLLLARKIRQRRRRISRRSLSHFISPSSGLGQSHLTIHHHPRLLLLRCHELRSLLHLLRHLLRHLHHRLLLLLLLHGLHLHHLLLHLGHHLLHLLHLGDRLHELLLLLLLLHHLHR